MMVKCTLLVKRQARSSVIIGGSCSDLDMRDAAERVQALSTESKALYATQILQL
jgi:hypothetical protein